MNKPARLSAVGPPASTLHGLEARLLSLKMMPAGNRDARLEKARALHGIARAVLCMAGGNDRQQASALVSQVKHLIAVTAAKTQ